MAITDETYVALTTFKKDGEGRMTPVWIADPGDGTGVFTTSGTSWKVKRIGNDPRVTLQPSNAKGDPKPGSSVVTGTARVVPPTEAGYIDAAIKAKYGIQRTLIGIAGKLRAMVSDHDPSDTGIVITFDEA